MSRCVGARYRWAAIIRPLQHNTTQLHYTFYPTVCIVCPTQWFQNATAVDNWRPYTIRIQTSWKKIFRKNAGSNAFNIGNPKPWKTTIISFFGCNEVIILAEKERHLLAVAWAVAHGALVKNGASLPWRPCAKRATDKGFNWDVELGVLKWANPSSPQPQAVYEVARWENLLSDEKYH